MRCEQYPRSARLTKAKQYSSVFSYRCISRSPHFFVFVKPNSAMISRLGTTISRRVAPLAVDRNYMKRVVREIYRHKQSDFRGLDIVVQLKIAFSPGGYAAIESELLSVLEGARKKCLSSS